jgi:hypothetical protein
MLMSKFFVWLEKWLPGVWACLATFTITGIGIGSCIWVVQWIISLLGVL